MKYKKAWMITGVALTLAITGLAYSQIVASNAPQLHKPKSSVNHSTNPQASVPPSKKRQLSDSQSNDTHSSDSQSANLHSSVPHSSNPQLSNSQPDTTAMADTGTLKYKLETYNSPTMGGLRSYGVVLPPDYQFSTTQRYPVIFLLHGGHGTPKDWFDKGAALATIQQLYASGQLPPSLIITPDGNDLRGSSPYWDPQYIDGPNGEVATAVGDELVRVIQSRYRTLPSPDFWAIGGLSSGGWGAMNVGLQHRNHFSILFSHSGYFRDKSGLKNSPIYLVKTLSPQDRQRLRIYLDTGSDDSSSLSQNRQFHTVLNQLKITNVLREFPGEHTWRYWREHLADSLAFVGEQFQQAELPNSSEPQGSIEAEPH